LWKVLIDKDALKYIESLGKQRSENIKESLKQSLRESPFPGQGPGDKKEVKGTSKSAFRIRIRDYRASYVIEESNKVVKVTEVMTAEAAHKKYGRM
jgi:mRNA-degrading endonuclease RelE of RelBE toxin-antitoxin system